YRRALCIDFSDENGRHMSINDFGKAILYYRKSEIYYELDQAYCDRGYFYGEEKKYREAILDFNSALKINPNNYMALGGKAITKKVLGDYKGSIIIWNRLIKIFPEKSEYYFERGKAKFLLNDLIGACADFSKAGDLGEIEVFELLKTYCQ
ncbi:MAG: tetratricopeptide repeat protein, partial [Saprospiraceae bacterium]